MVTNNPRRYYAKEKRGQKRVFAFRSFQFRRDTIRMSNGKLAPIAFNRMSESEKRWCYDGFYYGGSSCGIGFRPGHD